MTSPVQCIHTSAWAVHVSLRSRHPGHGAAATADRQGGPSLVLPSTRHRASHWAWGGKSTGENSRIALASTRPLGSTAGGQMGVKGCHQDGRSSADSGHKAPTVTLTVTLTLTNTNTGGDCLIAASHASYSRRCTPAATAATAAATATATAAILRVRRREEH